MASEFKQWSGDEWQSHIAMLLKRHYPPGHFQEIPDRHLGDAGLEGFTNDGCAYQCYAPEEPLTLAERANKHKQKIYRDTQKLNEYKDILVKLLGKTKISCWILVVPKFDSKDVIAYGELQAAEIRKLSLPFIAAEFCVRIITDDQFAIEREQLMGVGLARVSVQVVAPKPEEVEKWSEGNATLVRTLDGKLARMKPTSATASRYELRAELIRHYVAGQNAISLLHQNYGELYEKVVELKTKHEQFLTTESMTATGLPTQVLRETIAAYSDKLEKELLGIDSHTAKVLVWEAISDWLLRCPLDFEQVA